MHIQLGDGSRHTMVYESIRPYAERLSGRLEAFVDAPYETIPDPVVACGLCRWRHVCRAQWEADDSLTRIVGITRSQRRKLVAAGVTTRTAVAAWTHGIPRLDAQMVERLRNQASLQSARAAGGLPTFVLREPAPRRGFALLPQPALGDLFFDIEGDPFVEGGLEYLFGIVLDDSDREIFRSWWAHDRNEERMALANVVDFMVKHLAAHPGAHVYHYNHYEPTALKCLV